MDTAMRLCLPPEECRGHAAIDRLDHVLASSRVYKRGRPLPGTPLPAPRRIVVTLCYDPNHRSWRRPPMSAHKFRIGQIVHLKPAVSRNVRGGAFQITKRLPESGGEPEYRIKSMHEPH